LVNDTERKWKKSLHYAKSGEISPQEKKIIERRKKEGWPTISNQDKRTEWIPPTKKQKQYYKSKAKDMVFKPSLMKPEKGICPKCKTQLTNKGFASSINRNKGEFLYEKRIGRAWSQLYFKCKKCGQIITYQA